MNFLTKCTLGAVAILFIAGGIAIHQTAGHPHALLLILSMLSVVAGVPVVTYQFQLPPLGTVSSTTAPTAAQAANITVLVAQVFMDTSDTTTTITHNWGLGLLNQDYFYPIIVPYFNNLATQGTGVTGPGIAFSLPAASTTPANSVTVTKNGTGANTGCTFTVVLLKPHTLLGGV